MLDGIFSLVFLAAVAQHAIPFVLAAMGGTISERSGVVNIALEGKLLVGAFCAAVGAIESGSVVVGVLSGMGGGMLVAGLYAMAVLRFHANQIVSGVAINLMALGLTRYLLKLFYGSTANSPPSPGFPENIVANPMLYVVIVIVIVFALGFQYTRFGLRLRAVGEHPEAAETLGISPYRVRWISLLIAGAVVGLGGAWLALSNHGFSAGMSNGKGYIALAAVIMGAWRPWYVAAACLFFATEAALELQLQIENVGIPSELISSLPYILTMVALSGLVGRSKPPAALGKPLA